MNIRNYLGIPYKTGGEDFDGVDCYTICRLFSKNELGVELPDHSQLYSDASITSDAQQAFETWEDTLASSWIEVTEPQVGDVVIFNFHGAPTHCGLYLGDNNCLHASEGTGSYIAQLYGSPWERRLKGIMRWN